jgi:hypothetical protein
MEPDQNFDLTLPGLMVMAIFSQTRSPEFLTTPSAMEGKSRCRRAR